ncbi:cytosine permease [Alicyclobacillus fastidiosus]|uniref:Cytosine permease n=1 Tax=Alicyclobacillus fastidiosus TaxID=392011 RepID=A0ABY6ZJ00_9BACL|nr:cytosine permease [Alicyclobacillus fastidiosus]WAH42086.1 cytosine permease [Alicyclobacillus fastidiosus]GMA63851.1 cytosine permease [Alicyclobacillus fastidiosus]
MNQADPAGQKLDDYSLSRVPDSERRHWFGIATMRFGQMSALSQFLLGATLGFGMNFWHAFFALTLGAVILEIISIFVGIAGMKEGLSTTMLVRWTGFGRLGSVIVSIVIAISLVGWFGVQNQVFADGLNQLLGGPIWLWSIVTGALVTVVVIYGFLSMGFTAYITVPLFMVIAFFSIGRELTHYSFGHLVSMGAPGPALTLGAAASMVAGGFITGAIISPDMTRYNRSVAGVIKQTVLGITLGEYVIGLIGVLLAHATKSANVITIVMSTSGVIGTVVLVTATLKINDWNLYSSSLGIVNLFDVVFRKRISRVGVTILFGAVGTLLSVLGILDQFEGFLTLLGVAVPPVGGIMVVEYFLIRRYKDELQSSRERGVLPSAYESWNPITLVSWIGAFLVGELVKWGIPSINSLVVAAVAYYVLSKLVNRNHSVTYGRVETKEFAN